MLRAVLLAVLAAGSLAAGGCGSGASPSPPPEQPRAAVGVETTDGRLGDATEVRPGRATDELSRGGKPDLRERDDAPRRDGVGAGAACPNAELAPAAGTLPAVAEAALCLLNGERADRGLAPLAPNPHLTAAASAYAQDLVAGSYFSHTGRDGSDVLDRIERAGYLRGDRAWRVGENLAWGTGALATPGAIVRAWMNSTGHRGNVLNPAYREIGVGVVVGNPSRADGAGATYATEFGVIEGPSAVAAAPKAPVAAAPKPQAKRGQRAGSKRSGARKRRAARRARLARRGHAAAKGRGKGSARRVKARGPRARIAV
jgi:uncharacterized protein YkwD